MTLAQDAPLFIAYSALIVLALGPIYFGSYQSLRAPRVVLEARKAANQAAKQKKDKPIYDDESDDDDDDEPAVSEMLTSEDAYLFPIIGSAVLFSLYLVFKYLDRTWVDRILGVYFAVVGSAAVYKVAISLTAAVVGPVAWKALLRYKVQVSHTLTDKELETERKELAKAAEEAAKKGKKQSKAELEEQEKERPRTRDVLKLRLSRWHLPLFLLALVPVVIFHVTRHWMASNVIALCLALNAVSLMGLDSFITGSIMLGGLFLYDIFWVFGTEVMVSVARNFEAGPIKILFPKNLPQVLEHYHAHYQHPATSPRAMVATLLGIVDKAPKWQMTMLGLGDIVIPGIFIALALRFDQHLHLSTLSSAQLATFKRTDIAFPKPYFVATMTAYVAGLVTTMAVMHVFQAAQPALLYLSPACVFAVAIQAAKRGEWSQLWAWKDDDLDEADSADDAKVKNQ
ncbi:unnamed protein product [Parajaminaea phylloscopi]